MVAGLSNKYLTQAAPPLLISGCNISLVNIEQDASRKYVHLTWLFKPDALTGPFSPVEAASWFDTARVDMRFPRDPDLHQGWNGDQITLTRLALWGNYRFETSEGGVLIPTSCSLSDAQPVRGANMAPGQVTVYTRDRTLQVSEITWQNLPRSYREMVSR